MGSAKVPHVYGGMLAIIVRGQLGALIGASLLVVVGPVWRPPPCFMDRIGRGQNPGRLLAAPILGKVPYFDGSIYTGAEHVLTIGVPVDRGADALVVGCDFLLGALVVAKVPALYVTVVSAKGKFYSIGGRPLHIADATVDARVMISAATGRDISAHVSQVPQADSCILTGREEQVALVRIKCKLVHLAVVLVQAGELNARAVQVVENDLAVGCSSGDMRAELAVRPLHVMDAQALALAGMGICIVEHGSTQIGLVDNLGVLQADRLENLLASEDCMGALAVDVEGRDVEAGLMAGILRICGADAGVDCLVKQVQPGRKGRGTYPGSFGTSGFGGPPSGRLVCTLGGREA